MKKIITITIILLLAAVAITASAQQSTSTAATSTVAVSANNKAVCIALGERLNIGSLDSKNSGEVSKLQQFLKDKGYYSGVISGNFGPYTFAAVKKFQRAYSIDSTGNVGPYTRAKIHEVSCGITIDKDLSIVVTTDKRVYKSDDKIVLTITATNKTAADKVLNWNNGCQASYVIGTFDSTKNTMCAQSLTSVTIPAKGSKTWTFTHDLAQYPIAKGGYSVVGMLNGYGYAATNLNIVPAPKTNVTVLSPNGGETLVLGSTKNITWKGGASTDTVSIFAQPYIVCIKAPCPMYMVAEYKIAENVANTGSYNWTVGTANGSATAVPAANYKIMVCVQKGTERTCDMSDQFFKVVAQDQVHTPTISSISPTSGTVGTEITITGTNFSQTNNVVHFGNGVIMNVASANGTSIKVQVPSSINPACFYATPRCMIASMFTAPGSYNISVTNAEGNTSNAVSFTVTDSSTQAHVTYSLTFAQTFAASNQILMTLTAKNDGTAPATLTFPNGCLTSYTITDASGTIVYNSNMGIMCTQIYSTLVLKPGESKSWTMTHDLAVHPLSNGTYTFTAKASGNGQASAMYTVGPLQKVSSDPIPLY